jgi:hypothetical protein
MAALRVNVELPDPGAAMLAGLKVAVTPEGWPLADREIAESKPPAMAAVMVDWPDPPGATVTAAGAADKVKLGTPPETIVRLTPAVAVTPPPVALIVIVYVPAVAPPPAVSVRVDEPDPGEAMVDGLKLAVTPAGRPVAVSEIAELKLSKICVETVVVPELPAFTVSRSGLASTENLPLLPDHGVPPLKSLVNVPSSEVIMAALEMISPNSRFSVNEALEKFSEPTKTCASGLP